MKPSRHNNQKCPNCGEYKVCPEIREDNYIIGYICDACGWDSGEPNNNNKEEEGMETQEDFITTELQKFNVTEAAIATMSQEYMGLIIQGLEDVKGYKAVHDARMVVVKKRTAVTKTGKELREDANRFNKAVLAEEKRILALLSPIEKHLTDEESKIDTEKTRIKTEAEEKERARIQARIDRLEDLGMVLSKGEYVLPFDPEKANVASPESVASVPNEIFERFVQDVITAVAAEKERLANIEAEKKAEADRMAKVAAEQEAERIRLEEEAKKQRVERDRIETERNALEAAKQKEIDDRRRAQELEVARMEAAERARIEAEGKAKRDAEEKERLRLAAIEEARIQEELKPDKEKLLALADMIRTIPIPTLKHKASQNIAEAARANLLMASKHITEAVAKMKGGK